MAYNDYEKIVKGIKESLMSEILNELDKQSGKIVIFENDMDAFPNYAIFNGDDKHIDVCVKSIYKDEEGCVVLSYCDTYGFGDEEIMLDATYPYVEDLIYLVESFHNSKEEK